MLEVNPKERPTITFEWVSTVAALNDALNDARLLIAEFGDRASVNLDFQGIDAELAALPGEYAAPAGGLLIVRVDDVAAGCCAFRRAAPNDYPNSCELKRLYLRKDHRGVGLGSQLLQRTMDAARAAGYSVMLLDTLYERETIRSLYSQLGFDLIAPYYYSPIPGAHHLKAAL